MEVREREAIAHFDVRWTGHNTQSKSNRECHRNSVEFDG